MGPEVESNGPNKSVKRCLDLLSGSSRAAAIILTLLAMHNAEILAALCPENRVRNTNDSFPNAIVKHVAMSPHEDCNQRSKVPRSMFQASQELVIVY